MTAPSTAPSADETPVITLDPTGADHMGEAARLRAAGPVVRVVLPGGLRAWAVTTHDLVGRLVRDERVSKDWREWTAVKTGELADDNPIVGMIKVTNMVTADGAAHHRLRRPVTRTFTSRRVQTLAPSIAATTAELLDALPGHAGPDGAVDLRAHLSVPLPMRVICELLGVPGGQRARLRHLVDTIFRTDTTPEQVVAVQADIPRFLGELIELRTREPGDDLTSALIATRAQDPESLSDEELAGTLWVLLTAGHETTIGLITNAVRALLTHPDQLATVLGGGEDAWSGVVEEVLRWDPPIGNFLARYPLEDVEYAGVTIPAGDAIMAPYTAVARDPEQHGPDADLFDLAREPRAKHLAFGDGPHVCLGPHLARLETRIALQALFERYPRLEPAADPAALPPVASLFTNSVSTLPVRLGPAAS
ncbi:cytochrome P450 [Actinomadura viridis]|uniref:Cytochrome P450 n=1 Tax=Actinomadura viridis TaxID=58110 RepID=A0A931DTW3_9ACTN|nr:cytochrome P450 [Actinomadura viridis]MBG6093811.1 cytochrome P450 [Actinomadura viridis]